MPALESLIVHYNANEFTYALFMVTIGFANSVHTPIFIAYSVSYAMHFGH